MQWIQRQYTIHDIIRVFPIDVRYINNEGFF